MAAAEQFHLRMTAVGKHYGTHRALDDFSVCVPAGSTFGLVGPNGAGKTTAMRIALGIVARDRGEVSVLGRDPAHGSVNRRVGYLPEERGLYKGMPVLDMICFFGGLKGMSAVQARRRGRAWLEQMGLARWSAAPLEALSKGMQQKVQLIVALVHDPELLILDEPASGLDPINSAVIDEVVAHARLAGRTLIFSSHDLEQVEQLCEYVCMVVNGRVVIQGRLADILQPHIGADARKPTLREVFIRQVQASGLTETTL